jgi:hypothetical protein
LGLAVDQHTAIGRSGFVGHRGVWTSTMESRRWCRRCVNGCNPGWEP